MPVRVRFNCQFNIIFYKLRVGLCWRGQSSDRSPQTPKPLHFCQMCAIFQTHRLHNPQSTTHTPHGFKIQNRNWVHFFGFAIDEKRLKRALLLGFSVGKWVAYPAISCIYIIRYVYYMLFCGSSRHLPVCCPPCPEYFINIPYEFRCTRENPERKTEIAEICKLNWWSTVRFSLFYFLFFVLPIRGFSKRFSTWVWL